MHIGLIGGIGPAATVFYYERITRAFAAAGASLNLTIGHTSAVTLSRNAAAGRNDEQAAEFTRVTGQLAAAGAEAVVISSMGGHFCAKEFAAQSPLPLIDGPTSVANYLDQAGLRRVGVLGTRVVMETHLYGALRNLEPVAPVGDDLSQVNDDYVAVAIAGTATPEQRSRLLAAGDALVSNQGAEAVLLGGTDLNLVYDVNSFDHPIVDSAAVHVDAIVARALADTAG
ncbi:MAG: aspartate/glutamate racemase family protein [Hyphomicrobiaceae bacterium]